MGMGEVDGGAVAGSLPQAGNGSSRAHHRLQSRFKETTGQARPRSPRSDSSRENVPLRGGRRTGGCVFKVQRGVCGPPNRNVGRKLL